MGFRAGKYQSGSMDPAEILTRHAAPPDLTIRYGPDPGNIADIRLPSGGGPGSSSSGSGRPMIVLLHGGFWRVTFDRAHTGPMAVALAAEGYLVCVPEFRRAGPGRPGWPGIFDDVAAAIDRLPGLVAAVAPEACDPGRVLLAGHSAGGHLALWAAGRHRQSGTHYQGSPGWCHWRPSVTWSPATGRGSAAARLLICSGAGPSSSRNATP